MQKSYQRVLIAECGEPVVPLPPELQCQTPHPYQSLGAPYGDRSPDWVRMGVLKRLYQAQAWLKQAQPDWRLAIYDAYRPVAVQAFMVEHSLKTLAALQGQDPERDRDALLPQVLQFWSLPSLDRLTPPPHSTAAAIDLSLCDRDGNWLDMGSAIDELSPRSYPQAFRDQPEIQARRDCLATVMMQAGFHQHPNEWWHFSYGDQMWAEAQGTTAIYGRID